MSAILTTHGVAVRFPGNAHAVRPTSLAFTAGDFTVLLGSSGAGKSTLLRCLNGLVRPTTGRVEAAGLGDVLRSRAVLRQHRAATGMVFQQHQLIGRLSALANVLTGRLGRHGWLGSLVMPRADQLAALAALDRVGLLDRALERIDRLSGGQQQRVGIARALAQQPRLVLADEPVASLDPVTAIHVLQLLHDVCKADGITAIVSLHQVDLARRFADRIVGLSGGAVVFDGPPLHLGETELAQIYGSAPPDDATPTARMLAEALPALQ